MIAEEINKLIPDKLEQELNACTNLPSLHAIALKIIEASKDPNITLHNVAAIISGDPALSAKLLKIANSPLYSQRRALNNVREALTLLGFNAALTITLSFSLLQSLSNNNINQENYWKRSILAASIARLLGARLRVKNLEDLFLASLLQDIGILVIQCIDESLYPVNNVYSLSHNDRIKLETDKIGIDHTVIGAWILNSWNIPQYIIESVLYSHSLNIVTDSVKEDDQYFHYCVNLSGNLADIWLTDKPKELLHSILDVTKKVLRLNSSEFNQLIIDIDNSLPEITAMFNISIANEKDRDRVLNEARELLLNRSIQSIKQSEDDRRHIEDMTTRIEEIEKSSRLDHLTKIYNRQYIDGLLESEYKEATLNRWPLSVAFIDIDNFKSINDKYGHLVGDEVLKLIASFFAKNIRETDVLARYGGDEFLLMFPGSNSNVAKSVLQRLLDLFKNKISLEIKGGNLVPCISVGLATHMNGNEFDKLTDLMTAADQALYQAKDKGKNQLSIYTAN